MEHVAHRRPLGVQKDVFKLQVIIKLAQRNLAQNGRHNNNYKMALNNYKTIMSPTVNSTTSQLQDGCYFDMGRHWEEHQ